eukprot:gene17877-23493_t
MSEEDNPEVKKYNRKVKIKKSDVPENISQKAITFVNEAIDKYQIEKDMATYIKKRCDERFGGTWHTVIGRNFGCSITHDTKFVMFFQIDLLNVLLFKSME